MSTDISRFANDLWDAMREYLPAKKADAALAFLQVFADHGHDGADLTDVQDDPDLSDAFSEIFGDLEEDMDYYEE